MKDANIPSIMVVDDSSLNQDTNDSESKIQHCKHGNQEMIDTVDQPGQLIGELPDNTIPETRFYRLDQLVFAEPIEVLQSTEESGDLGSQDVGEITFVDNIMVKKRAGKRNRYFINIKDGSLDCPVSQCSQSFATRTLLKAHVRKVHCATRTHVCEQCGLGFTAAYLLRRHSVVHSGGVVECGVCGKKLSPRTETLLKAHVRKVHCATTTHVCEQCGLGFTAAYLLRRHSVVHSGGVVECGVCGKKLSPRTDLSTHMKTHNAARQHECAACGKRFLRLSSLRRHESFVHRSGPIVCQVCEAKFTSRKLFTRHRATHAKLPSL